MSDDKKLNDLHNEGEKDGAQPWGSYDPPHGVLSTIFSDTARKTEENEAYNKGFRHARDQKD